MLPLRNYRKNVNLYAIVEIDQEDGKTYHTDALEQPAIAGFDGLDSKP
jgi:hypothetical protein